MQSELLKFILTSMLSDIMATTDMPQIDHVVYDDGNQSQTLKQVVSESDPLSYNKPSTYTFSSKLKLRFKKIACLRSKSVILLLLWSFLMSTLYFNYDPYSVIILIIFLSRFDFLSVIVSVYAISVGLSGCWFIGRYLLW